VNAYAKTGEIYEARAGLEEMKWSEVTPNELLVWKWLGDGNGMCQMRNCSITWAWDEFIM
jgi:hypothetical protein